MEGGREEGRIKGGGGGERKDRRIEGGDEASYSITHTHTHTLAAQQIVRNGLQNFKRFSLVTRDMNY